MIVILLAGHLTGLEERCRGTWFGIPAGIWRHGESLRAQPFHPRRVGKDMSCMLWPRAGMRILNAHNGSVGYTNGFAVDLLAMNC